MEWSELVEPRHHVRRGVKSASEDALRKCESIYSPEAIAVRPYWHPLGTRLAAPPIPISSARRCSGSPRPRSDYPCGHPHPPASSRRGLSGGARARASTVLPVPERSPTAMSSGAGERRFSSAEGLESEFQFAALGLLRGDNQDERASRLNVSVATPSEISSISCFSQLDAPP